jgi:hypothetical protein
MAMTPYSGDTSVIGKLGTTPQERGLTTQQFKDKFDEGLKAFVEWFNLTHKTEFDAHLADNTAHGVSHKNLLHNWDFSVWQRGDVFGPAGGTPVHTADRWLAYYNNGLIRVDSTCPLKNKYAVKITTINILNSGAWLFQRLENLDNLVGKVVTISAYVKVSKACTFRFYINNSGAKEFSASANEWELHTYTFTVPEVGLSSAGVGLGAITAGETFEIGAVKLELGDTSTLANDPPADYREQLVLCKSFLRNIILSPDEADAELMDNGDIWIKYEIEE